MTHNRIAELAEQIEEGMAWRDKPWYMQTSNPLKRKIRRAIFWFTVIGGILNALGFVVWVVAKGHVEYLLFGIAITLFGIFLGWLNEDD